MEIIVYAIRCIMMFLIVWLGVRIVGKKSIAQITSYDLAGILLLTTVAAEPLVYKIPSKATEGVLVLALLALLVGKLSLNKKFYNIDQKPSVVVIKGKIDKNALKKNNMNIAFLLSQLRLQKISKISEVEFAIVEPNGQLSVIPKSDERALKPKDMSINPPYDGLALPLIIDGEIQYRNLEYAKVKVNWLETEIKKAGNKNVGEIILAEIDSQGQLYVSSIHDMKNTKNDVPPIF